MRKIIIKGFFLPVIILLTASCKKEIQQPDESNKLVTAERRHPDNGCRLTAYDYYDGIGDFHNIDQFTYKNGLVEDCFAYYGYRYHMEYDEKRKLIASKLYEGETLLYLISFTYKKGKVVQETWRDALTQDIADDIFMTYDKEGNMLRNESFIGNYYTTYTYTHNGNLKSWFVVWEGVPAQSAEYTYYDNRKNPFLALPGLTYTFWYTNSGFGIGTGKRWYSSEKAIFYDENGDPYTYYEQDPAKTIWTAGDQNYPAFADYTDKLSGLHITNGFEYENCKSCNNTKAARPLQRNLNSTRPIKGIKPIFHGPSKSTIEKLKKLRNQ